MSTDTATPPIPLPLSLKRLVVDLFDAEALRHLASLKESQTRANHRQLDDASVDELAEMLTNNRWPTIGWWKRHAS